MKRTRNAIRLLCTLACLSSIGFTTPASAASCAIDGAATKQAIDGLGFASVWSGKLSTAQNDILFGTGSGQLGFTLLRVRIDPNKSWADETANASAAHARGAKVLGTPWSPPASMKTNNNVIHGSLRSDQYAAYATYLNQAATSMGLDWVSLQNEPDWDPDYEGCTWTGQNFLTFMLNNAGTITKPIVMPEALGFNDTMSDPSLNNATAAARIAIVAGHFYGNGNYVHTNAISKGKHVWMTEYNMQGKDIATGLTIAKQVSDAFNNQFSAYFWWWVSQGSQTTIIDGTTPRKTGYALGQFARVVRPGMTRIGTTYNPSTNVYVTAYKNGSTVSIVAVNTGSSAVSQQFTFSNLSATSLNVLRTSGSENLASVSAATVSNGSFTYNLPAQSVTSFSGAIGGGTTYALNVTKSGTGAGTVTSSTGGINCGSTCSASYTSGTTVTLTAAVATGSTFVGWGGACTGTGTTCSVSMTAARAVTATFDTTGGTTYALSVAKAGTGSGTVTSSTGGISCGSTCSASIASGTAVTLTAAAASGSTFGGWSGACTGTGTCVVTMTAAQTVTATFTAQQPGGPVSINVGGTAAGNFVADVDFSGGTTYSTTNAIDTSLLTGTVPPQTVLQTERYGEFTYTIPGLTAGSPYTVTLYFAEAYWTAAGQRTFNVAINGATVLTAFDIFAAAGTNKAVAQTFNTTASASGQVVIAFTKGGGPDNPKVCGIAVAEGGGTTYALNVTKDGTGTGTVAGGSINCGSTCSATLASGTTVTLNATAQMGSTFAGWSGDCTGFGVCSLSMTAPHNVTATFSNNGGTTFALTVAKNGTGSGTVAGGSINCGSTCSADVASGTAVTLTATAATGSTFTGWSGDCAGTGTCALSMTAAHSVTATFNTSGGTCTAVSGGQSGNFNTAGAICFTVTGTVNGWGCSNADGRTVSVNGTATTCGKTPLPGSSPYTFSFTAGSYTYASFYWW